MRTFRIICLTCVAAYAQTDASPTFDAASIKPAAPPESGKPMMVRMGVGGPGTRDPGRIDWRNVSLTNLPVLAHDVKSYQVSGLDWLTSTRFDVSATIARDATKAQFHQMLKTCWRSGLKFSAITNLGNSYSVTYSIASGDTRVESTTNSFLRALAFIHVSHGVWAVVAALVSLALLTLGDRLFVVQEPIVANDWRSAAGGWSDGGCGVDCFDARGLIILAFSRLLKVRTLLAKPPERRLQPGLAAPQLILDRGFA